MLSDSTARTLRHYEANAQSFWEGTSTHDVSQNVDALLSAIEGTPPFEILDFGCGPGRDLRAFQALGHHPIGLDGCESFVAMAKAHASVEVWHQDFLALSLPAEHFDGVFANASLFHVPSECLPRVLGELRASLKWNGVVFCSNPRGNCEGWRGDRYACHFELERWLELFRAAGFDPIRHYYRPEGRPCAQQPWLALLVRKQWHSHEPPQNRGRK